MKKFAFTLQKMLNFRDQLFEREKNTLGQLRLRLVEIETEIAQLDLAVAQMQQEFEQKALHGVLAIELAGFSYQRSAAREKGKELEGKRYRAEMDVELQRRVVLLASQEVEKLKKLREKQIEEYRYKEQKQFAEEISEQVVIKLAFESLHE